MGDNKPSTSTTACSTLPAYFRTAVPAICADADLFLLAGVNLSTVQGPICDSLQQELALLKRLIYKSKSQHRGSKHSQRLQEVKRLMKLLLELQISELATELEKQAGMKRGTSTPLVAVEGAAIHLLSRQLGVLLLQRLLAACDVLQRLVHAVHSCFLQFSAQLALTFFMPTCFTFTAVLARVKVLCCQYLVNLVSLYNRLVDVVPAMPRAQGAPEIDGCNLPGMLACEWRQSGTPSVTCRGAPCSVTWQDRVSTAQQQHSIHEYVVPPTDLGWATGSGKGKGGLHSSDGIPLAVFEDRGPTARFRGQYLAAQPQVHLQPPLSNNKPTTGQPDNTPTVPLTTSPLASTSPAELPSSVAVGNLAMPLATGLTATTDITTATATHVVPLVKPTAANRTAPAVDQSTLAAETQTQRAEFGTQRTSEVGNNNLLSSDWSSQQKQAAPTNAKVVEAVPVDPHEPAPAATSGLNVQQASKATSSGMEAGEKVPERRPRLTALELSKCLRQAKKQHAAFVPVGSPLGSWPINSSGLASGGAAEPMAGPGTTAVAQEDAVRSGSNPRTAFDVVPPATRDTAGTSSLPQSQPMSIQSTAFDVVPPATCDTTVTPSLPQPQPTSIQSTAPLQALPEPAITQSCASLANPKPLGTSQSVQPLPSKLSGPRVVQNGRTSSAAVHCPDVASHGPEADQILEAAEQLPLPTAVPGRGIAPLGDPTEVTAHEEQPRGLEKVPDSAAAGTVGHNVSTAGTLNRDDSAQGVVGEQRHRVEDVKTRETTTANVGEGHSEATWEQRSGRILQTTDRRTEQPIRSGSPVPDVAVVEAVASEGMAAVSGSNVDSNALGAEGTGVAKGKGSSKPEGSVGGNGVSVAGTGVLPKSKAQQKKERRKEKGRAVAAAAAAAAAEKLPVRSWEDWLQPGGTEPPKGNEPRAASAVGKNKRKGPETVSEESSVQYQEKSPEKKFRKGNKKVQKAQDIFSMLLNK